METTDYIDIRDLAKKIWKKKKIYCIALPIVAILSYLLILGAPRYYTTSTSMAPELGGSISADGALSSIASSFGIDLGQVQSTDAISPLLYPDLMNDNKFVVDLLSIKVKNEDGSINTSYYEYLKSRQKSAWWTAPVKWMQKLTALIAKKNGTQNKQKIDPYHLSERDNDLVDLARNFITISVDRKTAVISVSTQAQDPIICKILADSTREYLQKYITLYRTNKAKTDVEYYTKLTKEAKQDYEKTRQIYGSYADANMDVVLESYKAKQEDLENDMQLKFNTYTALNTQLQAAKAKLQDRTPVFTTIEGAPVPVKPAGPKRMLFAIGMMFVAFIGITIYVLKDEFKNQIK